MSDDAEVIPLLVTLGHVEDDSLLLRFPSDYLPEIEQELDARGIGHGAVLEMSAGNDLWIEAVKVLSIPGGLAALASALRTFIQRHDGKKFVLERDGEKVEAAGISREELLELLQRLSEQQARRDAEWRRVSGTDTGTRSSGD